MKIKKDIEVLIKVPKDWLDQNELDLLTTLGRGFRGKLSDKVIDGAVDAILKEIDLPKIKIKPSEIKSRMLDILAERALEGKEE